MSPRLEPLPQADALKLTAPVALEEQMHFAIREGGKTVGAGVVTKVTA